VDFDGTKIKCLKVIDFGSSFVFSEVRSVPASTPEYLAPEVLQFLDKRGRGAVESCQTLFKKMKNWSFDMWSLGALLLEILSGFPLWLSYKGKITNSKGNTVMNFGIFGVSGRNNSKIINKQTQVLKNLGGSIKKYDSYGYERDTDCMDLLRSLLEIKPKQRITPSQALNHPFLN
jgi:serine/threonine protein kinase